MFLEFGRATKSVNEASTLPAMLYTDATVFDRELEKVFNREWICVGRADAVSDPGDYVTYDFFGAPILIARSADRGVNAFSNVCLHRGCLIAQGKGRAERGTLTCPYHRWRYGLDGTVKGAPLMHKARGFNRSRLRLRPLQAEQWQGWIFVNADPDAKALAPALEPLTEKLAPQRLDAMKVFKTLPFDSPWNWKIMVENFMESYHHSGAHHRTLQQTHPAGGTYIEKLRGPFALLENPPKDDANAPFSVVGVFPSHLFAVSSSDPPFVSWYEMKIGGHDRFHLDIHLMAHDEALQDPQWMRETEAIVNAIHLEDIPVCESVWKGMHSRYFEAGRMSHLEEANWRFHNFLRQRMEF